MERDDTTTENAQALSAFRELEQCDGKLDPGQIGLLHKAFPVLLKRFRRPVLAHLYRRGLRDPAAAEDVAQEVFVELFKDIQETGAPPSYDVKIYGLTRGLCLNHLRGKRREPVSFGMPSSALEPPVTGPEIELILARRQVAMEVFDMLSEEHKDVIDMVVISGISHEDAAKMLGIRIPTLKSRLNTAKERLAFLSKRRFTPSERHA